MKGARCGYMQRRGKVAHLDKSSKHVSYSHNYGNLQVPISVWLMSVRGNNSGTGILGITLMADLDFSKQWYSVACACYAA